MKTSTPIPLIQTQYGRFAAELKDAVAAMRMAESALEYELAVRQLEQIAQEMERAEWESGA